MDSFVKSSHHLGFIVIFIAHLISRTPPSSSVAASDEPFSLHILHTNDIHSRFEMFNKREVICKPPNNTEFSSMEELKKCQGGIVRRAGFVNDFRRKHPNVLLLDAGDQFQGTPWFYTYKGVAASHFLNRLKYDAMALGNHEFDNGVEGLDPFLNNVSIPILCANLVMDGNATQKIKETVKSHVIIEIGGRKIGIIGYITDTVPILSKTGNLSFIEEQEAIEKECIDLKSRGIDIIIALGHSGLKKDKELAAVLTDVDVIVGGHSHSLLYNGVNPALDEVIDNYPLVFKHTGGETTLVVQAGSFGKYVGVLNLTFDSRGKLLTWFGNPVPMDERVPEDEEIKVEMEYLNRNVSQTFKKVVGSTLVPLDASENICRIKECNIGDLYTDSMIDYIQEIDKWQGISIAITGGGTFRASLDRGDITYGDVLTVFPFGDNFVVVQIDGATLIKVFEHSVSGFDLKERKGKFLQVSGLRVTYNMENPDGSRVKEVKVRDCYRCPGLKDLNMKQMYNIILPGYLLDGGDGYVIFKKFKNHSISVDMQDSNVFISYLKKYSPVTAHVEGRILGMETFPGWRELIGSRRNDGCSHKTGSIINKVIGAAIYTVTLLLLRIP